MSTSTDAPPEITTVTIHTHYGAEFNVLAQPTKTPGLVVSPQIGSAQGGGSTFTGYWEITHSASGMAIKVSRDMPGLDIHTSNRVADTLGETNIDWTVPQEQLSEVLRGTEATAAVWAAIKRGMYPPTTGQWDGDGSKPVGPGGYPNSFEQATANQLAGAYTSAALHRYMDGWELIKYRRDDDHGRRMYNQNTATWIAEYGIVHLLRAFIAVDPDAADAAARDLWEAHQAGDSHGEWLVEWAREYGIEAPQQGDAANFGATPPEPLSYEQVMGMSLAYPDHGTIGEMRQELGRNAARHNKKFSEFCDRTRQLKDDEKVSQEDFNESNLAHSGAWAGWALVGVLGWLAKHYPPVAVRAARMVDDIGTNGGNDFCQDIDLGDGRTEPAEPPPTATTTPE